MGRRSCSWATWRDRPETIVLRAQVPNGRRDGWAVALATPGLELDGPDETVSIGSSQAILLTRCS
jgi:hypothetical protein